MVGKKRMRSAGQLAVTLAERDLTDARRILARITRASDRRAILDGARPIQGRSSEPDEEDPRERFALRMFAARAARDRLLPNGLSAQPAWDVLLAVYVADKAGVEHNIGRMVELARMSVTTGLRYIDLLEAEGLVRREQDKEDGRVIYLHLSERGREVMDEILSVALTD